MIKHKQLLIIFFLLIEIAGFSQESRLTIMQAVEIAYNNSIELNRIQAQLKQKESLWQNVGISQPEISYFKEGIGSEQLCPFSEKRITISQEIEFPLTIAYRVKALKQEVEAQKYLIKARENEIKFDIKNKYIEVLYARFLLESGENQQKLLQDLYNFVCVKSDAGFENSFNKANALLQLNEIKNDYENLKLLLFSAKSDLYYSMNLSVDQQNYDVLFPDSLNMAHIDSAEIVALLEEGQQTVHSLFVHNLNANYYFSKEVKSNIFPDLRFSLYKQDYGIGYDFKGFEIGLSLPLWRSFDQREAVKLASDRHDEILEQHQKIKLKKSKQIKLAWQKFSVSREIIDRYENSFKLKDIDFRSSSLKAYQRDEVNLFNLLQVQQLYFKNQQQYISALCNYYRQLVVFEKYIGSDLVF